MDRKIISNAFLRITTTIPGTKRTKREPKGSDSIESGNLLLAAMTKTSPIKNLITILHHLKIKHMTQMGQNV